jgi:transcriptional regulator with XRE-family HTH domain
MPNEEVVQMTKTFNGDLKQELQDPEFAKMFGAAQAKSSFAITLAEARRQLNLTQQQLAAKLGVSQSYVAKLEGGEANPTLERIGSLLAVLGLSLVTDTTMLSPYTNNLSQEVVSSKITDDVMSFMKTTGVAWMSIGWGSGQNRAVRAAKQALTNLDVSVERVKGLLLKITGSSDLALFEVSTATQVITQSFNPETTIIFEIEHDPNIGKDVRIILIATGYAITKEVANSTRENVNRAHPPALFFSS